MKKITPFLLLVFCLISCSKEESINNEPQEQEFGTKKITVSIVLPEDSNINPDDLTVSSLFTNKGEINNGTGTVKLFDDNAIELIYATNSRGNVVLMRYLNPSKVDNIVLDSKSTAQTLVMLHPWTMHLSIQARQESLQEIALMPEFTDYHNLIIQGINANEIDPLASQMILQAIDSFQDVLFKRVEEEKAPLSMVVENNMVSLTNKESSLAYSLQIYDENEQPTGQFYTVAGVNKEIISWSNVIQILNGNFDLFQPTNVQFPIPSENQKYNLKADRFTEDATWLNGVEMVSNLIGIFSTSLKDMIKNADCAFSIGSLFYTAAEPTIINYVNGNLTYEEIVQSSIDIIYNLSSSLYDIIIGCSKSSFSKSSFVNLINQFSTINNIDNGIVLAFNILDLGAFDNEIEFCFEKTDNEIIECNGCSNLTGVWVLSLNLGNDGLCDETVINEGSNLTLEFNDDGTITFLSDPDDYELNSSFYTQNYTCNPDNNNLGINIVYNDPGIETITFVASLTYNNSTNSFSGTYTNNWGDGNVCNNSILIYQ